jgi:Rhomboid family
MERLLARLERRFGKLAVEHLTLFLVGGMALAYVGTLSRPEFVSSLSFDLYAIRHGQLWRLVTFLFIPEGRSTYGVLFNLYWLWFIGSSLEAEWGAFKLNVYYFVGVLLTIGAATIAGGGGSNIFLNYSLTFAFATIFPDFQILMMFILPMRMKWVGWIAVALSVYQASNGGVHEWAACGAAFATYLLFFAPQLVAIARGRAVQMQQASRRQSFAPPSDAPGAGGPMGPTPKLGQRACAICAASEADGADIRVCSCEKCGGTQRQLCLTHARNH